MPKGGQGKGKGFPPGAGRGSGTVLSDQVGSPASLLVKIIVCLGLVGVAIGLIALVII